MNKIYPLFRENVTKHHLVENHDTVILGFSGGKDSVTLFCLLRELEKDIDFQMVAAYFNHNLRTDSDNEQEWVRDFCKTRDVELIVGSKNLIEFKEKHKLNLEHAASISRYGFFKEVSDRYQNSKVATAHTQSDLTETFLIKLSRGSGLQGLSTIYHKKENTLIRPLLLFDQEEIVAFLDRNKIPYYQDYTNKGDEFLRNRIRHHVVPPMQEIEPEIHKRIFKTVSIIQAEYDYFSEMAKAVLDEVLICENILPAAALSGRHVAVQRHIIREYIRKIKGNLLNIDFEHIEVVRTRNLEVGGAAIPGIELMFHKGFIYPVGTVVPGYSYKVGALDPVEIKAIGKTIYFEKKDTYRKPGNNNEVIIPMEMVKFPLTVRNAVRGDKYIKINTKINQKVYEMIRASGIPSEIRNLCPVVENGDGEIIWVEGAPVADRFKVKEEGADVISPLTSSFFCVAKSLNSLT